MGRQAPSWQPVDGTTHVASTGVQSPTWRPLFGELVLASLPSRTPSPRSCSAALSRVMRLTTCGVEVIGEQIQSTEHERRTDLVGRARRGDGQVSGDHLLPVERAQVCVEVRVGFVRGLGGVDDDGHPVTEQRLYESMYRGEIGRAHV